MAKNYIEPKKELIRYTCPHCNTISQVEKDGHYFQSDNTSVRLNFTKAKAGGHLPDFD